MQTAVHQEDPLAEAEGSGDQRGVEAPFPAILRLQAPDEQCKTADEEGIARQVEHVRGRRHGRLGVPDVAVEIEDDVADAETEQAGAEQVPRQLERGSVEPRADDGGDGGRGSDRVVEERLREAVPRQCVIECDRGEAGRQKGARERGRTESGRVHVPSRLPIGNEGA